MALTVADLYQSPDHYLHSFDGDAAVFVPMDRMAYHRSIFLDGRISPARPAGMRLAARQIIGAAPARPLRTGWIFHVAHCGSTLLARALDRIEGGLVLREPLALRQAAVTGDPDLIRAAAAMVSKRYDAAMPTIVKANVPVNFVLDRLAALDAEAPAILLRLSLEDYVCAILRDEPHREWLRRVTSLLQRHLGDLSGASDAVRLAALWMGQMEAYAAAVRAMPNARSLDAERFFTAPRAVLGAVAEHLGAVMPAAELDAVVAGPVFATYSKDPARQFDDADRVARRRDAARALGTELAEAERWVTARGTASDEALAVLDGAALAC